MIPHGRARMRHAVHALASRLQVRCQLVLMRDGRFSQRHRQLTSSLHTNAYVPAPFANYQQHTHRTSPGDTHPNNPATSPACHAPS